MFRLDEKLARIAAGPYTRKDFIIADAKDPDMGPGLYAVGPARQDDGTSTRLRTREEFLQSIEAILEQDVVDIMLTSVSNLEQLVKRGAFKGSKVKPAIRANDTTDIWRHRGATYHGSPSRPFRTAALERVKGLTNLGLYSMTFNNDIEWDWLSLEAFACSVRTRSRTKSRTSSKCSIPTSRRCWKRICRATSTTRSSTRLPA